MGEARRGTEQERLLRQVVLLHQEVRIHLCRLMGMHDTDYAALALLMRGRLGPSALASALGLSSAAATAVVDRLEAAGHAERLPTRRTAAAPWCACSPPPRSRSRRRWTGWRTPPAHC